VYVGAVFDDEVEVEVFEVPDKRSVLPADALKGENPSTMRG